MPFTLDPSKLRKGDVLLTRNKKGFVSWLIRIFTFSPYSHAALYVGDTSYMEAIGCGVHARNVLREVFLQKNDIIVLRDDSLTDSQIQSAINFIRFRHGMAYSVLDAIKSGICIVGNIKFPFKMRENQTFCSQLVASAFDSIGKNTFNGRQCCFVRPVDIYKEKTFKKINDVYREIGEEEVAEANGKSFIDKQDEVVSSMMSQIWKILKKERIFIKGVPEIDKGIFEILDIKKRKKVDSQIDKIIKESGYLTLWEDELAEHPESFSASAAMLKYNNPRECAPFVEGMFFAWNSMVPRFSENAQAAMSNYNLFQLNTSKTLLELAQKLHKMALQSQNEFAEAYAFLRNCGLIRLQTNH